MQLQQIQDDSPMSIQIRYREIPKPDHNPMDLYAILNPSDEAPITASEDLVSKEKIPQASGDPITSNQTEQHLQLPSIGLVLVHGQCQSRPSCQLPRLSSESSDSLLSQSRQHDRQPSINLYSPQASDSVLDHQATLNTLYNNGDPTPPPSLASSPTHGALSHTQYVAQTFPSEQQHGRHLPSPVSRSSLSPRQRAQQDRGREGSWNVQHPHTYTPYSPPPTHQGTVVVSSNPQNVGPPPQHVGAATSNHPHSNKPYTTEQVHFLRYHREDCGGLSWPQVLELFLQQFPEYQNLQWPLTVPCLSSRYYRANKVPMLDEDGDLVFDSNGKVVMIPAKVRGRNTGEGKTIPYMFVDMHPDFALLYDWVKPEDRAKAMHILQGLEEVDAAKITKWQRHQRSLQKVDRKSPELVLAQKMGKLHVSSKL